MSNAVQVIEYQGAQKPLTAIEMQSQVNVIQQVMNQVMKKDTHFGVIPGTKTPSLYKPGAEKIMATFRLSADPEITDMSDGDQIRYQVKVRLLSPSGVFVGAGIGECSSNEEKYKWRRAVCQEEFDETDVSRRREKWSKGWNGKPNYKQQQIRTEPADLANTILKMAKKRALIDAVLTATAASDCFTQDIEDLPPEYVDQEVHPQARQSPAFTPMTPEQVESLRNAAKAAGKDDAYVCQKAQIARIEDLPQARLQGAINHLKSLAQGAQQ